jgi:hypothetical protein
LRAFKNLKGKKQLTKGKKKSKEWMLNCKKKKIQQHILWLNDEIEY